jgi:hypothetical protein
MIIIIITLCILLYFPHTIIVSPLNFMVKINLYDDMVIIQTVSILDRYIIRNNTWKIM